MTQQREPKTPVTLDEHIVEIVSDSGEGAQKAGQTFGNLSAKMGNGVWTVEIIPAEIQPPARSPGGASGNRIRVGSTYITNAGNEADLVVAFNEQVLYSRIASYAYKQGTVILLENKWKTDQSFEICQQYQSAVAEFREHGLVVIEVPMEVECLKIVSNARKGKNMFVVGMLCHIYRRDLQKAFDEVQLTFGHKGEKVVKPNQDLLKAGYAFAAEHIDLHYEIPSWKTPKERDAEQWVVMNGNQSLGLGIMASGMELVSMYPITPATSASHYLADVFVKTGGFVHQAEDEIAAIGFALGASYAGRTACTITSGPGIALKTEFIGLSVMGEIPLVLVDVQRGGPSTGLPTKVEQGDLLALMYGEPGDAPKIIIAPATIEECFHFVIMARKLAETFRGPVVMLTDANLATGVQPFRRPKLQPEWFAPPIDQSAWDSKIPPYDWDEQTGLSSRPLPGQPDGEYVLTGLAHTFESKVVYDRDSNQKGCEMRSKKLATLRNTLQAPTLNGADSGDLLVVGWGSTLGAIEEAVGKMQKQGHQVSSLHLRFLSPMEPDLKAIFARFKKVMTVEINYSDRLDMPFIENDNRRYAQLATLLRGQTLVDIDCWSNVYGQPMQPGMIYEQLLAKIEKIEEVV